MIKANELRIGNWIIFPFGGNQKVTGDDIANFDALGGVFPIPLTPEILEKAGAKTVIGEWQYSMNVGALKMNFRHNIEWYSELGGIYLGGHIQSLHQLQNLYFALTQTELTIQL